ncbi:RHS repeat-associated core domain-containing protein [Pseudomonas sp. PB120]|nr:RHS repeat-associated core domain-containing protein [Pseudomonas sp. PB120]MVV51070.1 RHS repeat-associated core domain-containing protein [Pseudomonas sp. PB120]
MQSNHEKLHFIDPHDRRATTLLATDQQRTVLSVLNATGPRALSYTPYGHRIAQWGLPGRLGFNGEQPDPVTGHYLLGNGYRALNPVLMRFNSPDSWSPFGEGGLNAYAYCVGDPVNRLDPTGHVNWPSLMQKHFPKAVAAANKRMPRLENPMGDFQPFENMPDVMGSIIGNLKGKDISALSATSSKMFKFVNEAKISVSRLLKPKTLAQNKNSIQQAWDIATGEFPGTTPNQLKTIGINNPYDIPHIVDSAGFSSLAELERRFNLHEKAMKTQKNIRQQVM